MNLNKKECYLTFSIYLLLNLCFANNPNIVAESDSTKPIALDAVEVLAETKSITSGMFLRNAEPSDVVSNLN